MSKSPVELECREALAGMRIPDPWSADHFISWLAAARRRRIAILPWPLIGAEGIGGCWVEWADVDYIVVDKQASPLYRSQIICHEAAHMWLGHKGHTLDELGSETAAPHSYSNLQEHEAETLADLILEAAGLPKPPAVPTELRRVMDTLYPGVTVGSLADSRRRARRRGWRGILAARQA